MSLRSLALAFAVLVFPGIARADFNFIGAQAAQPHCKDPAGKTAACPEAALSYERMTAGQTDFQLFFLLGYRDVDASKLGSKHFGFADIGVGARWFPRAATFWLGSRVPVRATVAGAAAYGWGEKGSDFPVELSAGLAISGLSPEGGLLEAFYRFTENPGLVLPSKGFTDPGTAHLTAAPHAGARLSFFF